MDPQHLQAESNLPLYFSKENLSRESHPSIIHNDEPSSHENRLNQLNEPLISQPNQISSTTDPESEESKAILKKVKDIDNEFEQGWIYVYNFWLSVVIGAAALKGVLLADSLKDWLKGREYEMLKFFAIPLVSAFFSLLWLVRLALLHKEALKKKDPMKAAQAYSSLVKTVICFVILGLIFSLTIFYGRSYYSGYNEDESSWIEEFCSYLLRLITSFVILVGMSAYGSYKVKTVLEERTNLLEKISNTHLLRTPPSCSKEDFFHQLKQLLFGPIPSKIDPKEKESKTILKKLKDVDQNLEEGWFFAYELWLYIVIIAAPTKGVVLAAYVYDFWTREDTTLAQACSVILVFALYYIFWSVQQALLHLNALKKKDQEIAAKAFRSLLGLAIYYLILCFVFFSTTILLGYLTFEEKEFKRSLFDNLCKLFFMFVANYVIPVGISICGSYRLKNLLKERKNLIGETELPQPPVPEDPLDNRLKEIDQRLDKGELFLAYKVWLYLTPVLGMYLYQEFYLRGDKYHYNLWDEVEDRSSVLYWGPWVYTLHCLYWFLKQAWFELIAIKQRDLKMATYAYDSLVWLAKYYFVWVFINLLNFLMTQRPMTVYELVYEIKTLISISIKCITYYLIPVGINIYGSRQVKDLLEKRQALIYPNNTDSSESKI